MTGPSRDISQTRAVYAFLRPALRHGTETKLYRGPARLTRDSFTYTHVSDGTLDAFWGLEEITQDGAKVYELRYAGGFLG
ncbi:MAG: DUF5680 domain-containing protein [Candidatus Rokuibacteriota bacterium]